MQSPNYVSISTKQTNPVISYPKNDFIVESQWVSLKMALMLKHHPWYIHSFPMTTALRLWNCERCWQVASSRSLRRQPQVDGHGNWVWPGCVGTGCSFVDLNTSSQGIQHFFWTLSNVFFWFKHQFPRNPTISFSHWSILQMDILCEHELRSNTPDI